MHALLSLGLAFSALLHCCFVAEIQAKPFHGSILHKGKIYSPDETIENYMKLQQLRQLQDPSYELKQLNDHLKSLAKSSRYDLSSDETKSEEQPMDDFLPPYYPEGDQGVGQDVPQDQQVMDDSLLPPPDLRAADIISVQVHPPEEEEEGTDKSEDSMEKREYKLKDEHDHFEEKTHESKSTESKEDLEDGHPDGLAKDEGDGLTHGQQETVDIAPPVPAALVQERVDAMESKSSPFGSISSVYLIAVLAGCGVAAVSGLMLAGLCYYRLRKRAKETSEVEYPAYGVTGPTKDKSAALGDRKLAQSAQMYHYQHQKQQMIASERLGHDPHHAGGSEGESEEEGEEGDYTVFECPGLATAGEMEVRNPLFNDQTPGATPAEK